jgi:hypothetical protein
MLVKLALGCTTVDADECWVNTSGGFGGGGTIPIGAAVGASSGDYAARPQSHPPDHGETSNPCVASDDTESPRPAPGPSPDPCQGVIDTAGDGATFLSCSDACSSKCPPPGIIRIVSFKPSDFPFVTIVEDDSQDEGAGWQEAKANLEFEEVLFPTSIRGWYCPLTIRMPLRTALMGRIDASRAASLSVEIATAVALDPKLDYKLPRGIFCKRFAVQADAAFKSKYRLLGASVTNP